MSAVESGIDTAVWIVGVILGLAVVFGPVALVGWLLVTTWRRLGVLHRWRAFVIRLTGWRERRRWLLEPADIEAMEQADEVAGQAYIDAMTRTGALEPERILTSDELDELERGEQ